MQAYELLTSLIDDGYSFHALTFNLATVYELCTERSRAKKMELAEKVACKMTAFTNADREGREDGAGPVWAERGNANFKI